MSTIIMWLAFASVTHGTPTLTGHCQLFIKIETQMYADGDVI